MAAKPRRASDDKLERLQALADTLAAMTTDAELEGDMSGDDAVETLGSVITWARTLSSATPAQFTRIGQADPDAFSFSIGPPTLDNCKPCGGTGEISEFPADDDERLVACPNCGGTGEVYE